MDKYSSIEKLVAIQKDRKVQLENIFLSIFGFVPKTEINLTLEEKRVSLIKKEGKDISFILNVKIKDKSSVIFVVKKQTEEIISEYKKIYPNDILVIK